jgi:hypothetical protein
MDLGQERATKHLSEAASLEVIDNTVKVTNLTGHKLITGYPEGRRMWLRIEWRDANDQIIRVDGEYGPLLNANGNPLVTVTNENGVEVPVESILDLDGTNTRIYEAHYAITKDWAATVQALHGPDFALSYDRETGLVDCSVGQFLGNTAAQSIANKAADCSPDHDHYDTFHFALNNYVSHDNRIPPYEMSYDEAQKRNALPVPADQYGNPGPGGSYEYWDIVDLNPPEGADHAHIQLLYQGTSWEYQQFLQKANNGTDPNSVPQGNAFLGNQGEAMMAAWINADVLSSQGAPITSVMQVGGDYKMVPPVIMATVNWGNTTGGGDNSHPVANDDSYSTYTNAELSVPAPGVLGNDSDPDTGDTITVADPRSETLAGGALVLNANGSFTFTPNGTFTGVDSFTYHAIDNNGAESNTATVTISVSDPPSCGAIGDKGVCNGTPGCQWSGSPRSGTCESNVCSPTDPTEVSCMDGIDNDCDGNTDCADTECSTDPACQQVDCSTIQTKDPCNAEATCRWDNRNKVCVAN